MSYAGVNENEARWRHSGERKSVGNVSQVRMWKVEMWRKEKVGE